ncbi:putative endopolygalacturonase C [Venturia nashicola]|uniref:Putative endopolygalacturonase C n=1 Tax=Venturia nashicola TaxID=86259 RepID=A0A4Z1P8X4_9PEZI|nr:putative endopolygalacturonase C [Venturia nashicola]TLD32644.1 putative endopolygalacturonase C [Venturia nashicola]
MKNSLESSRPMLNESTSEKRRASTRFSTYSMAPTLTPSIAPSHLSCASDHTTASLTPSEKASPLAQDIRTLTSGLARLDQPKLQNQRYTVSEEKKDQISKIALGAKLERALGRRMTGQDASFSTKKVALRSLSEKEVSA